MNLETLSAQKIWRFLPQTAPYVNGPWVVHTPAVTRPLPLMAAMRT